MMQSFKKIAFLLGAILLFVSSIKAQQSRVYSQFFMNPFIYNPAYAGVEGHSVFFGMYRKQWSNIDGAPSLSHFSFHTPLKGGLGVGVTAFNEGEGLINTTAIKASIGYLLAIDRKHYLRVGMSLGGGTKSINTDGFDSPADPAFASLSESSSFTLADFGATYHFGHFNVGIALPNVVGYEIVGQESFSKIKVDPLGEALFKANYRGHINDDFAFEPHLLYRYNENLPNQFEAALIAHLKHIVWVGASYRQDAGIIALFGTKIKEKIGIGFAYDLGNSKFSSLLGPTLEFHIGYHLGTKKDHAEHVSSFIKSHRKSLEEREDIERGKQLALQADSDKENKSRLEALKESRNKRLSNDEETPEKDTTSDKPSETPNKTSELATDKDKKILDKNKTNKEVEDTGTPKSVNQNQKEEIKDSEKANPVNKESKNISQEAVNVLNKSDDKANNDKKQADSVLNSDKQIDSNKNSSEEIKKTEEQKPISSANEKDKEPLTANQNKEKEIETLITDQGNNALKDAENPVNTDQKVNDISEVTGKQNEEQKKGKIKKVTDPEDNNTDTIIKETDETSEVKQLDKKQRKDNTKKVTNENDADTDSTVKTTSESQETEENVEKEDLNNNFQADSRTIDQLAESEIPKKVKRGNHLLELDEGNYVVAGAFKVFDHSEDFSDQLFEQGYKDVIVGYISETQLYYVVIFQSKNLETARKRRSMLKTREGFSKVWLLTVE